MKRKDGYQDLTEYFKRITKRKNITFSVLEEKGLIKQSINGASALFWFKYFDVPVLYKALENEYSCYSELVSEELAKHLGFKSAQYDLATFNGQKGVITYDFKNPKYNYISLYQILKDYINQKELKKGQKFSDLEHHSFGVNVLDPIDFRTNLEDIWNALESFLYNETDFDFMEIPALLVKAMTGITDYFAFQIIGGNFDYHSGNIMLVCSEKDNIFEVSHLYDNEDMFKLGEDIAYGSLKTPRLAVERENFQNNINSYEVLRRYFQISDQIFYDRFKYLIDKLDYTTIYCLFDNVEEKTGIPIPDYIKTSMSKAFNDNLTEINKIVSEYTPRETR